MSTDCYYITKCCIIPTAVLCTPIVTISPTVVLWNNLYNMWDIPPTAVLSTPVVTASPIAVLYQVLYYRRLSLLYYQVLYYTNSDVMITDCYYITNCCISPIAVLCTLVVFCWYFFKVLCGYGRKPGHCRAFSYKYYSSLTEGELWVIRTPIRENTDT